METKIKKFDNTSIIKLDNDKLKKLYSEWKKIKKFGDLVEKELITRYDNNQISGVEKVKICDRRSWKSKKELPEDFLILTPMTVAQAEKAGKDVNKYIIKKGVYKYEIK